MLEANLHALVDALQGRKSGSCWMALCPAHDDRNPSLSIAVRDGKLLVHCHAGCTQDSVLGVLRDRGLWCADPKDREYPDEWGTLVATYDYVDEDGELLYQVCRFVPKGFRPRYPDGHGGWTWKKHPRQVLYRLPEVLEAPIVFIAEGEKDVETLRSHGFVATTNALGAKAPWLDSYTEALRRRETIIVPDNDKAGWERTATIARALIGVAVRIRVFDLPANIHDISDWFAAGHSECELIATLEGCHAV